MTKSESQSENITTKSDSYVVTYELVPIHAFRKWGKNISQISELVGYCRQIIKKFIDS